MPVDGTTVAMAVLALVHVPPVVAQVSVDAPPTQTEVKPLIDAGEVFTVKLVVAGEQPDAVYEIVHEPAATPVTKPVDGLTEATPAADVDQVPPESELASVVVAPAQIAVLPVIGPGEGVTEISWLPELALPDDATQVTEHW
jgi:hypothetical protein